MAHPSNDLLSDRERVYRFARGCQLLAGHLASGSFNGAEARGILRSLLHLAGAASGPAAQAILSSLATQTVLRLRRSDAAWHPGLDTVLLGDLSHPPAKAVARILRHCLELCEGAENGPSGPDMDRSTTRVASAVDFVRANYADCRLRLETVARAVNVSTWHLDHLLKRHTGYAFRHHLRTARVEAAEGLLRTSHLTVKEISAIVGYNSTTQLDRDFHRVHGCSPRAWGDRGLRMRTVGRIPA
jgi:AraC-like DNA-binding protein